jgi:hypothetical protein
MAAMEDRREQIWLLGIDEHIDTLTENARKFHNGLEKDTYITAGFLRHFAKLFRLLIAQQNDGIKGALRYITMSFPKSSVIAETYEIVTTCHCNDLYMDETETETYWRMDFLKEVVEHEMIEIVQNLKKNIFRIRNYEIEDFRARYAYVYAAFLLTFFNRVLPRVFELPEYTEVKKENRVDITFGGYMEEALILISREDGGSL